MTVVNFFRSLLILAVLIAPIAEAQSSHRRGSSRSRGSGRSSSAIGSDGLEPRHARDMRRQRGADQPVPVQIQRHSRRDAGQVGQRLPNRPNNGPGVRPSRPNPATSRMPARRTNARHRSR